MYFVVTFVGKDDNGQQTKLKTQTHEQGVRVCRCTANAMEHHTATSTKTTAIRSRHTSSQSAELVIPPNLRTKLKCRRFYKSLMPLSVCRPCGHGVLKIFLFRTCIRRYMYAKIYSAEQHRWDQKIPQAWSKSH